MWFKVHKVPDADQHNYIILWSGKQGLRMFNTWGLTKDELKDPQNIWSKFSKQVEPQENFRIHHYTAWNSSDSYRQMLRAWMSSICVANPKP